MPPKRKDDVTSLAQNDLATPKVNSSPASDFQQKPKRRGWKKISLFALAGFVLIFLLSLGYNWYFSPTSKHLSNMRSAAKHAVADEFTAIENSNKLTYFATSIYDNCYRGQNNWKVKEGYSRKCDYQATRYYGFNDDLRQTIVNLDEYFISNDWQETSDGSTLKRTIYDYDLLYGKEYRPYGRHNGGIGTAMSLSGAENGYSKNGIMLETIEFAEKEDSRLLGLELAHGFSERGFPYYEYEETQNIKSLFNRITQNHKYMVAIALEKNYFEQ